LDAMGQMVRFQKARVKAGISLVHLNLAGMPPGHYSVRAVAANGMASNALMLILK
ncbi:MAG: hypothetical protein JWP27_189, partial [Flaviaesturariibacter sp.]|nr:hypothetical protein [Flaviaesturariibacter sp.]